MTYEKENFSLVNTNKMKHKGWNAPIYTHNKSVLNLTSETNVTENIFVGNNKYFYMVVFRYNMTSKTLSYRYTRYPFSHLLNMLEFLIYKTHYNSTLLFKEYGDIFVVLDEKTHYFDDYNTMELNGKNTYFQGYCLKNKNNNNIFENINYLKFMMLKLRILKASHRFILSDVVDSIIKKEYDSVLKECHVSTDWSKDRDDRNYYLLKETVFFCNDVESLVSSLNKNYGYKFGKEMPMWTAKDTSSVLRKSNISESELLLYRLELSFYDWLLKMEIIYTNLISQEINNDDKDYIDFMDKVQGIANDNYIKATIKK